jgi:EAL domain-containing protein (putative c-di-GMP-specific phosphodiesterase class I)
LKNVLDKLATDYEKDNIFLRSGDSILIARRKNTKDFEDLFIEIDEMFIPICTKKSERNSQQNNQDVYDNLKGSEECVGVGIKEVKIEDMEQYLDAIYSRNGNVIEPDFQPIRDFDGNIVKFEVLARVVRDGRRDSIYKYLDAVTLTGTGRELTKQMIEKSLKKLIDTDSIFQNKSIGISINITHEDLLYGNLSSILESAREDKVANKTVEANRITLEVLERDKLEGKALETLQNLEQEGYKIAIDDFGAECSSFDKISKIGRELIIKIDGMFVKDIKTNKRHQQIVKSIAAMAHNLNYLTIAEFVEDEAVMKMLHGYGIDLFQGYYNNGAPKSHMETSKKIVRYIDRKKRTRGNKLFVR